VTAPRTAAERGFTLLELVISMGMTAIIVAAAVTLFLNMHRGYHAGAGDRALQETAQTALLGVGSRIRKAGYGIDPAYALDFGDLARVQQQALRSGQKLSAFQTYACAADVRCRDQVGGAAGSDELVLYARNPMFSRPVIRADGAHLEIRGDLTRPIRPGQVLMVMCLTDSRPRAYVTASRAVPEVIPPDPAAAVNVFLQPGVLTAGRSTFPFQNDQLLDACFSDGNAVVAQVDRYRFFVAWYDDAGAVVPPQTAGARPYLMLDQGLSGAAGPILTPVAENVEDLQLTYFFAPAAANGGIRPTGATLGTNIADEGASLTVGPAMTVAVDPPLLDDPLDAASRTTGHPNNVLAVRVSVVVRSPEPDLALGSAADRELPRAANRDAFGGVPYYRRALFEDTFLLPNLQSSAVVHCAIGAAPGQNLGGC
jgi:prepilin-type N-terminal cleavage/methylation domain-containing protein